MADSGNLKILENVSLKERTTFCIGGPARWFAGVTSSDELLAAITFAEEKGVPFFILGGGSNLLVSDDGFQGMVITLTSSGIEVVEETGDSFTVRVAAGEVWDDFVRVAVERGWWGIENMSLIPGTVGAVPIQNVGAYGQDASQVIVSVDVLEPRTKIIRTLSADECRFSYRRSIFNREEKGRYIVLSVLFRLKKNGAPNLSHDAVRRLAVPQPSSRLDTVKKRFFSRSNSAVEPNLERMREIVISLREDGRLPDLNAVGNAGSFFQSPLVQEDQIDELSERLKTRLAPEAVDKLLNRCYKTEGRIKVPAVILMRAAGADTLSVGGAALYSKNPAILVNSDGCATAADVLELARKVRQAVFDVSGLLLPVEVERVGFDADELTEYPGVGE